MKKGQFGQPSEIFFAPKDDSEDFKPLGGSGSGMVSLVDEGDYDKSESGEFSCSFEMTKRNMRKDMKTLAKTFGLENPAYMRKQLEEMKNAVVDEKLIKMVMDDTERQLKEYNQKISAAVEKILREYVTPPIKGEITKAKLRYRGIGSIVYGKTQDGVPAFLGIVQRNTLIMHNGIKVQFKHSFKNINHNDTEQN